MRNVALLICASFVAGAASMSSAQVVPGPGYMVWQQGVNESAEWKRLGCSRDYASDAEKEDMIRRGECRNAGPAATRSPSKVLNDRSPARPSNSDAASTSRSDPQQRP
jgi:hypothetical protein